ncbi:MAG: DUF2309 domain-containing protein [Pseudotabrizicola sp.]|uniref:YbcC family protein n=1 Tax=Pseudotabrizicola sp. TaxID=2939647 RepID=UPI00272342B6|nr:DUF2309 domain-containing protein [Pseudotabrizicola sp.]MDO9638902.1 DUF2309 domain-containing protein [Pseudotabrizicola sp.]
MIHHPELGSAPSEALIKAANTAARGIPPLFPLASSVAVNPFLGQTGDTLAQTAARLGRVSGTPVTQPREWYLARIADGRISDGDLAAALAASPDAGTPADLAALKAAMNEPSTTQQALPSVAGLAAEASGIDWPGVVNDRFSAFAAGHFDRGQALWTTVPGTSAYSAWRNFAAHDLTPEIAGLRGFAAFVTQAPALAPEALAWATARLGLAAEALDTAFHAALMSLGGWSQYARYELWQAELAGGTDSDVTDFLVIRLMWDVALLAQYQANIGDKWAAAVAAHATALLPSTDQVIDGILQEAAERAAQRDMAAAFAAPAPAETKTRPALQAAFCIDVRSEVFRRALEGVEPGIQTIGFAGFFGMFVDHRPFASHVSEARLPVLLNSTVKSCTIQPHAGAEDAARITARAKRAWGRFKLAAVSSFAFVEATGPVYAGKLVRDALGLGPTHLPQDPAPQLSPGLDAAKKLASAEMVLRAMSMTEGFARIVLLAGHGANVTNNPHASALHCGACGGYSGEVNARLLAGLLNDAEVRQGLPARGIPIPEDTLFVAGLHDTTTDDVLVYDGDHPSADHAKDLTDLKRWLTAAGLIARGERALRLPRAKNAGDVAGRSSNWAEVRPEWGLAGCRAFVAASRSRTAAQNLGGRAFLHSYDWRQDTGFGVLELILTAPVVVASWINLQYYGSTVAPVTFGGGNKLLHNVTGGIGVVEGSGGLLRTGLPWQSVHDGAELVHEPLRLSIIVEAPLAAINDILGRHDGVRALFDNRWLHLFTLNDTGHMHERYVGGLKWEAFAAGKS